MVFLGLDGETLFKKPDLRGPGKGIFEKRKPQRGMALLKNF